MGETLIPTNKHEDAHDEVDESISAIIQNIPPDTRRELANILSGLDTSLKDTIKQEAGMMDEEKGGSEYAGSIFQEFENERREFRRREYMFYRDDVKEVEDEDIEMILYNQLIILLYKYDVDVYRGIVRAESSQDVKEKLIPFLDSIWKHRGEENPYSPNDARLEELKNEKFLCNEKIDAKDKAYAAFSKRMGKKQRWTKHETKEHEEMWNELFKLSGRKYMEPKNRVGEEVPRYFTKIEDVGVSELGKLVKDIEAEEKHRRHFISTVFVSERLSAEDFALITDRFLRDRVNFDTKRDPHVNPELLDFITNTMQKWLEDHKDEKALAHGKANTTERTKTVVKHFVASLLSYGRHEREMALDDKQNALNEIMAIARALKRI